MNPLVLFGIIAGSMLLVGWLIVKAVEDNSARTEKRLQRNVRGRQSAPQQKLKKSGKGFASFLGKGKKVQDTAEVSTRLDVLMYSAMNDPARFQMLMRQADLKMTVGEFFILSIGVLIGCVIFFWLLVGFPVLLSVVVGLVVGVFGLKVWFAGRIEGRQNKFNKLFPETLDLMVRGLRTGLPVHETFKMIAKDVPAPVGEEFAHIRDDIKLGYSLEEALWNTARRMDTQEFKFFAVTLSIQAETGGNLAETLENLSNLLRKREQIYRLIKAKAAEGKASALVLGSLPFIMYLVIYFVNQKYAEVLLYDPRGQVIAGFAIVWILLGVLWMRSIVRIDV